MRVASPGGTVMNMPSTAERARALNGDFPRSLPGSLPGALDGALPGSLPGSLPRALDGGDPLCVRGVGVVTAGVEVGAVAVEVPAAVEL